MDAQSIEQQALNLRDIHLPEPISWWPIAPGWWLLAAGLLLTLISLIIVRKIYLGRQLKRDIAHELEAIKQQYQQTQNKTQLVSALSSLIRRATMTFYPSQNIAGLTGEDWLHFLDSTTTITGFQTGPGQILADGPYQRPSHEAETETALLKLCRSWLKALPRKAVR